MKLFHPIIANFGGLILAVLTLAGASPVAAQSTSQPSGRPDFSTFKLITDRNIFDPRRRGGSSTAPRPRESRRTARVEYVTLVGTMSYDEKGPLAFFEGSSSEYRKVLKPSQKIAGYTVVNVGPSSVKLVTDTNHIDLPVGMQLRRDDEGAWHMAEPVVSSYEPRSESRSDSSRYSRPPSFSRNSPAAASSSTSSSSTFPPPPGEGESPIIVVDPNAPPMVLDPAGENGEPAPAPEPPPAAGGSSADAVLQRLMQQRAQEVNR